MRGRIFLAEILDDFIRGQLALVCLVRLAVHEEMNLVVTANCRIRRFLAVFVSLDCHFRVLLMIRAVFVMLYWLDPAAARFPCRFYSYTKPHFDVSIRSLHKHVCILITFAELDITTLNLYGVGNG